jgi:hypothetical protein
MGNWRVALAGRALPALILLASTLPASADTFDFSFINLANGGGTVTGVVILNATDTAALSLQVTGNTGTGNFGIGEYVGNPQATRSQFPAE